MGTRTHSGTCVAVAAAVAVDRRKLPTPEQRVAQLDARRALKMARSTHAYVRGSTQQFYEWLASASAAALPEGPPLWICGDCHVGNVGPVGRLDGNPVLELRDLDQTAIGNPAHDLVRLGLSLAMAARSSALPGVTTARMTEDLVAGYETAFAGLTAATVAPPDELPRPIRIVMKTALKRTWKQLFEAELEPGRKRLALGRRFWPLSDAERAALDEQVRSPVIHRLVTQLVPRTETGGAQIELVDAAYWVKGCSSLGLWRASVLVEVDRDSKKPALCLLDFKEAIDTVTPHVGDDTPADPAERVVIGARHLSPTLGQRMVAVHMLGRSLFVRELMPQDLKLEIETLSDDDARGVALYLGNLLGRAHGRQLDEHTQRLWRGELMAHRSKSLDAPSWLWSALLELIAIHERAYLEHCRVYALDRAA